MTACIYAMKFEDLFYIGRSSVFARRKADHINSILVGTANYKILDAYIKFGLPEFIIIEECAIENLAILEQYWIKEFDAVNLGLNISSGGDGGGQGPAHNRATHSEDVIIKVFRLLTSTDVKTYTDISKLTGVSVSTITNIAEKYQHTWLSERFPLEYEVLSDKGLRIKRQKLAEEERHSKLRGVSKKDFMFPNIKDTEGFIYTKISNAKQFAELHNLSPQGLCRLFSGKINSHRGWTLA